MKKSLQLFFGFATLATASLMAQPTLTATGINPVVGDHFTTNTSTTSISPGSSGANQTWNLTFSGATASTSSCVAVSSTSHASSYPNANVACTSTSGSVTTASYLKTSSTALQNYGAVITNTTTVVDTYSNPEDILHFPFSYSNFYTDNWASSFAVTQVVSTFTIVNTTYSKGIDSIKADAYGTLTTPAGTFSNVMRVHFIQNYRDSTITTGSGPATTNISTYRNDEYMWYLNGNHTSIASTSTLTSVTSFTTSITYLNTYLSNVVVGIEENGSVLSDCNLFPNPATNNVNISMNLSESQKVDIKLYNTLGAQVNSTISSEGIAGSNDFKLDVSTLPEGVYFAQIHLDGNLSTTRRFVVSK